MSLARLHRAGALLVASLLLVLTAATDAHSACSRLQSIPLHLAAPRHIVVLGACMETRANWLTSVRSDAVCCTPVRGAARFEA